MALGRFNLRKAYIREEIFLRKKKAYILKHLTNSFFKKPYAIYLSNYNKDANHILKSSMVAKQKEFSFGDFYQRQMYNLSCIILKKY